jgi:chaperonin cofactor prefoldin
MKTKKEEKAMAIDYKMFESTLMTYYESMGRIMSQLADVRSELDKSLDKYTKLGIKVEDLTADQKDLENSLSEMQQEMIAKVRKIIESKE